MPRSPSRPAAASAAARTAASTGRPPSDGLHATRRPRRSASSGPEISSGAVRCESGARASGPAIAPSSRATSAAVRPIGPSTENGSQGASAGHEGTTPGVGRRPTTPFQAAGLRSDPPRSLPSASGTSRQASATAPPPLEPPADRSVSHGLRVTPNTGLNVCEPAPHSGVFVLPTMIAPASRSRRTSSSSSAGTWSR